MDIQVFEGRLTGMNGVLQTIVGAVIDDPRWVIRWVGWNAHATERIVSIGFHEGGKLAGTVEIKMREESTAAPDPDPDPDPCKCGSPIINGVCQARAAEESQ